MPHPSPPSDLPTFAALLDLLVAGNETPTGFRGTFTAIESGEVIRRRRAWQLRDLVRVEDEDGRALLVAGERRVWHAGFSDAPRDFGSAPPEADWLLLDPREHWTEYLSENVARVTSTLHAVEYDGRAAWRFSAPDVKGGSPTVTVDADVGLVLRIARDDLGHADAWSDLAVLPDLEPSFFAPTAADRETERAAEAECDTRDPRRPHLDPEERDRLRDRLVILDAQVLALTDPHATLEVILAADRPEDAVAALRQRFGFDESQAQAVADLPFRVAAGRWRAMITTERDQIRASLGDPGGPDPA